MMINLRLLFASIKDIAVTSNYYREQEWYHPSVHAKRIFYVVYVCIREFRAIFL